MTSMKYRIDRRAALGLIGGSAASLLVPIPGARKIANIEANVAAVDLVLDDAEAAELGRLVSPEAAAGARYAEAMMKMTNL